ncbi:MAG: hypothetical protein FJ171_05435 [Gammaproteobacteria bacterium]|nr:hypothetical protein [Gammaproteobacteria bacterium]
MVRRLVQSVCHAGSGTATLLLAGCMTAQLDEDRQLTTQIAAHESVVLLAKPHVEGITAEDEFMDCVGNKMMRTAGIQVRPNDDFVDSMFPWLEPSTAPQRPEGVSKLLAKDVVAARIAESGVRYIVWIDGATRQTDSGGSITCAIGPAGGGCIGFGWWEKESDYEATVWDINTGRTAGSVSTNVTGSSALVGVVVPLPFIARVQGTACDRLAGQLGAFLKGEDIPSPAKGT